MQWLPWPKANELDLARYVSSDAVSLRLEVNRHDLSQTCAGRRRLVQSIYDAMVQAQINYAPEKYSPHDALQNIRHPQEILQAPGEGTCLDLALLFASACLAKELLPLVVVTTGHAFTAVSLAHLRREWNDFTRGERHRFDNGKLTEVNDLLAWIDAGNYLAVECTGFARSQTLHGTHPEDADRVDGYLTFEQAVTAGRQQLTTPERPFCYALDIATLHELGLTPPNPVWEQQFPNVLSAANLNRAKPCTPLLRPDSKTRFNKLLKRHTLFGGREQELARLDALVAEPQRGYCFIEAPSGFGKTALLANWTVSLCERKHKVCYHFISRADDATDERFALTNLCEQLAAYHRLEGDLPASLDGLRALYPALLQLPPADGQPIIVVLDALDEAPGWVHSHLFPDVLPAHVLVVFSARVVADVDWLTELELSLPAARQLTLDTLGQAEIAHLLTVAGGPAATRAAEANFVEAMHMASKGDPFYVHYLVQDILAGDIQSVVDLQQQPDNLGAYLDKWWAEVAPGVEQGAAFDLLAYLLVAKGPLPRKELINISDKDQLSGQAFIKALERVQRFVVGSHDDGYVLCHPRFREHIAKEWIQENEQKPYRDNLLAWCARWAEHRSPYALIHYASHLAEAIAASAQPQRHTLTERLVQLVGNRQFQALQQQLQDAGLLQQVFEPSAPGDDDRKKRRTFLRQLLGRVGLGDDRKKPPALFLLQQRDLEQAVRCAALNVSDQSTPLLVEAALALVRLRQQLRRPETLFELALDGNLKAAEQRLALFDVDLFWRQATLLTLAWLAVPKNAAGARQLRDRLALGVDWSARLSQVPLVGPFWKRVVGEGWTVLQRLLQRLDVALQGGAVPGPFLQGGGSRELALAILERLGGGGGETGIEPLSASGLSGDEAPRYLAEQDGPQLVAFAIVNPEENTQYLRQYIAVHAANPYVFYRNRSLAALVEPVLHHPQQESTRDFMTDLCVSALAGSRIDFREALALTVLGLQARVGLPDALQQLEQRKDAVLQAAGLVMPSRDQGDWWSHCLRRLTVLAEVYGVALGRTADAAALLQRARSLPYGFAGFRSHACLTLAEATRLCQPDSPELILAALNAATEAAHNIQDFRFCAPETCCVNALQVRWWPTILAELNVTDAVRQFVAAPDAPEFATLHIVGERYPQRSGANRLPIPDFVLNARTLTELAHIYQCTAADLVHLNYAQGWTAEQPLPEGMPVRVPDPAFAPLLAERLAAEALGADGLPQEQRVELIQTLVPTAIADRTALDIVLSRLLLAAFPGDPHVLQQLQTLTTIAD